jgi:hypothetical protein
VIVDENTGTRLTGRRLRMGRKKDVAARPPRLGAESIR